MGGRHRQTEIDRGLLVGHRAETVYGAAVGNLHLVESRLEATPPLCGVEHRRRRGAADDSIDPSIPLPIAVLIEIDEHNRQPKLSPVVFA